MTAHDRTGALDRPEPDHTAAVLIDRAIAALHAIRGHRCRGRLHCRSTAMADIAERLRRDARVRPTLPPARLLESLVWELETLAARDGRTGVVDRRPRARPTLVPGTPALARTSHRRSPDRPSRVPESWRERPRRA